ncbi:MAG: ATP synthase F1 subunit epsilon [Sandaracinaceae bacterium]|jgi:F-type H+-transporting ATPase subunit epsilon|nr:ATP synthase F1 subunit epsilon [Sandaracinaceae bacterium]
MALPDHLTLEVATPLGLVLKTEAMSVAAPSVHGEFGVFAGHLPLLAAVKPGLLKYRTGNKDHVAAVSAGFVEAGPTKVLLLTDQFALPKDIDESAVKAELSAAEKDLAAYKDRYEGNQYEELQRRIDWCNAQLLAKSSEPR